MTTNETKSVAIINDVTKAATIQANAFAKIDVFATHVAQYIEAGETVRMGALTLFLDVLANDSDLLDALPRLDTKTGNNPEFTKIKREGSDGERYVSYYSLLADNYPLGVKYAQVLADLKKRKENGTLDQISYDRDNKKWSARRTALRTVFRKMGKLNQYFNDIREFPLVEARPMKEQFETPDGISERFVTTSAPIVLINKSDPTQFNILSVDSFLRIDIDEAVSKAGGKDKVTKAHLMSTQGRDSDEERKLKPLSSKTFPDYVAALWNHLDKDDMYSKYSTAVTRRDAEGKALAVSLYYLQAKINELIDPLGKELPAWVQQDKEAKADAKAKKAAA
jgi:hypothetical protein